MVSEDVEEDGVEPPLSFPLLQFLLSLLDGGRVLTRGLTKASDDQLPGVVHSRGLLGGHQTKIPAVMVRAGLFLQVIPSEF